MVDHYLFTTVLRHVVIVVCCIAEWSELRVECEHVLGIFISFAYMLQLNCILNPILQTLSINASKSLQQ